MTKALALLGNPQDRLKVIHVAGTNGKGSTCAMLASVLQAAGYRTGLYTSPHLVRFNERIRIDGQCITDGEIEEYGRRVIEVAKAVATADDPMTFFEVTTLLAFEYLAAKEVDVAIVETGLGGRLDATNIGDCLVSVITHIAWDHGEVLGDSLAKIAREKAGIIRPRRPVIVGPQDDGVLAVIGQEAAAKGSPLIHVSREVLPEYQLLDSGMELSWQDGFTIRLPLQGVYQVANCALAKAVISVVGDLGLPVPEGALRQGLERVSWPGRMEVIRTSPTIVLDGAHNLDGAHSLKRTLDQRWPKLPIVYLFGLTGKKPVADMVQALIRPGVSFVVTEVGHSRTPAVPMQTIADVCQGQGVDVYLAQEPKTALTTALEILPPGGLLCVCGSLYLVGAVKELLGNLDPDPGNGRRNTSR